nr:hypothetical protein SHINE37_42326 [Rhizobiaceae bacterium]
MERRRPDLFAADPLIAFKRSPGRAHGGACARPLFVLSGGDSWLSCTTRAFAPSSTRSSRSAP